VGDAADAASRLLEADTHKQRSERQVESITSVRRQMRFLPEGMGAETVANPERYVSLTGESRAIHQCARGLKRQLCEQIGPEVEEWVAQDLRGISTR